MKAPEEIACALVDDFWAKGPECTQDYAREKIAAAIREARHETIKASIAAIEADVTKRRDTFKSGELWEAYYTAGHRAIAAVAALAGTKK